MKSRSVACLSAFAGLSGVASAQIALHGTETVAGRIYYHCETSFGSETPSHGNLNAEKDGGEDGSLLRMRVEWYSQVTDAQGFGGTYGIAPLYGGQRHGRVSLRWPGDFLDRKAQLQWGNPELRLTMNGSMEPWDLRSAKKEPWRQVLIDRADRLTVDDDGKQRSIDHAWSPLVLASPLMSLSAYGLDTPLADLAAWGAGADALTVYETRVTRQKFDSHIEPSGPGPNRIVIAYKLDPLPLVQIASEVRAAVEQWEASIPDVRSRCERQVESIPDIIVT